MDISVFWTVILAIFIWIILIGGIVFYLISISNSENSNDDQNKTENKSIETIWLYNDCI
jgi:heme/copper-type cytochrome/quinol oxidase subunit 2